ncbi:MAG: hypothetical protein II034_01455 [Muribaculaceae bacterium]|nr:hypothetical protein [Muribaculaceae bacterium]
MKKLILILAVLVTSTMAVQAKNYEINVGGVEVSSSNANNVTGKDITVTSGCSSGYVSYEESTNTLWLNNITIHRTGSGDYAIHNRKCDGLTIKFRGECYFTSDKAAALKLQRNTTLDPQSNSYTEVSGNYTNNTYALDIEGNTINITGWPSAKLKFYAGNADYGCVTRSGSGSLNFKGDADVRFYNDPPSSVSVSRAPAWRNVYANFYHGADVHVYGENYAIYDSYIHTHYDDVEVLIPYGGDYTHAEHVYFSSNYVAIINETNFPDASFRDYLMNEAGYSKGYITSEDVESRTHFDYINNKGIINLKGIEFFTNLISLDCSNNSISGILDLTKLTKLTSLYCNKNRIDVLKLPASLTKLVCNDNDLTTLNLTSQTALETLNCKNNDLTSMDVSKCSKLWSIDCSNNKFTTLDVSNMAALSVLYCDDNKKLTKLTANNNDKLYKLSVKNCTVLDILRCENNVVNELYLNGCSALSYLDCSSNYLWSINTLGECTNLKLLKCSDNRIFGSDMTRLVNALPTLPSNWTGQLLVIGDSSDEQNEITSSDVKIARNKRRLPKKYVNGSWVEILVAGDVNGDGKVNVSDVSTLINMIMGLTAMDQSAADVNGDGKVNVSDVSALINIILDVH